MERSGAGDVSAMLQRADRVLGRVPQHEAALAELRGRAGTGEWRTSTVAQLVRDLRAFGDPERGLRAGVAARRAFAAGVLERSVTGPEAQAGWEAVRARTADPAGAYGGRPVPPQIGLLPLGPDPASGLLEFAHLQTGEAPARDPRTGALILSEETALVFVLLPVIMWILGGGSLAATEFKRLIGDSSLDFAGYFLFIVVVVVVASLCMLTSRFGVFRILKSDD